MKHEVARLRLGRGQKKHLRSKSLDRVLPNTLVGRVRLFVFFGGFTLWIEFTRARLGHGLKKS